MGLILLQFIALTATVVFLTYVVLILVPFTRRKPTSSGNHERFSWHLFVPALNEHAVIAETVQRARADFPFAHVWVIDDHSDDDTAQIVDALTADDDHVHLVRRRPPAARTGKGAALNAGYAALNTWLGPGCRREEVIVGVIDADGRLAPDALDQVAADTAFGTPEVGAVQIAVRMENRGRLGPDDAISMLGPRFSRWLVRMQDMEFMTTIAAMQMLRGHTGSVGLGGNGQFSRLSVLDDIAMAYDEPWHGALLEDYELGLHVLLTGHQNRFIYDTHVEQEGLTRLRRLMTQRTRWTQGTMQCSTYLGDIMRSPHLSNAAVVESSYFLITPWLQTVGVIVWPLLFAVTVFAATTYAGGPLGFVGDFWPLITITLCFGILPFALWGPVYRRAVEPRLSRTRSWLLGVSYTGYLYYTYLTTWRAAARVFLGRHGWAKTRRNAEVRAVVPEEAHV